MSKVGMSIAPVVPVSDAPATNDDDVVCYIILIN